MRLFRVVTIACGILGLAGCSIPIPPIQQPAITDTSPSSQVAVPHKVTEENHPAREITVGEFLNAGQYPAEMNAFGAFRPCPEISPERWGELGWSVADKDRSAEADRPSAFSSSCALMGVPGRNVGEAYLRVNFDDYAKATGTGGVRGDREDFSTLAVTKPAGFYVYASDADSGSLATRICVAGVMTKRGRIAFEYTSPFMDQSRTGRTKLCQTAVDSLSQILDTPVFTPAPAPAPAPTPAPVAPQPSFAPAPPPAATPAPDPAPPAPAVPTFTQALGVGDYSPQDQVAPAFDPCTMISVAQWQSVGWRIADPADTVADEYAPRYSCVFRNSNGDLQEVFGVENTYKTFDEQSQGRTSLTDISVNKPDTFILTDFRDTREWQCSVDVVTSLGRISATYMQAGNAQPRITKQEACQRAVDRLQAVFGLPYEPPSLGDKPSSLPAVTSDSTPTTTL